MATFASVVAALGRIGYGPDRLISGYEFSDVGSSAGEIRSVEVAAFTHTPPSYRSAAFAVLSGEDVTQEAGSRKGWLSSLGAPVAFVVAGASVDVLRIGPSRTATPIARLSPESVVTFIEEQRAHWSPDALRRLKLFGTPATQGNAQLDFFDRGLLPSVEAQTQRRLKDLLGVVLAELRGTTGNLDRTALSLVFRMLAAKVLIDRHHPDAAAWGTDAESILDGIRTYYGREEHLGFDERLVGPGRDAIDVAWSRMRASLTLRNVSSDDLAFVYESSFVTEQARLDLGTHSTPREVVEYACDRLPFDEIDLRAMLVLEPFAGAGVFLIAALRRMVERLGGLSTVERHSYLVDRIAGADADAFACHVARLALILADYPNRNGWRVEERDLFASPSWLEQIGASTILFCNPPYEPFSAKDKVKYAYTIGGSPSKALWAASRIVARRPAGLALVLPRAFALEKGYDAVRAGIEAGYRDIEVVSLPENTFAKAGFETCLVIGKSLRPVGGVTTRVTSAFVSRSDLAAFKATKAVSWQTTSDRSYDPEKTGPLWAGNFASVWEDLRHRCEPLSSRWEAHRGIEWLSGRQRTAWTPEPTQESRPGYHPNDGMQAFEAPRRGWLDVRPEYLLWKAHRLPWGEPKVILNAARRSRGPWRVTAFVERDDVAVSQQFIALWAKSPAYSLDALAAVLNGPVANAFLDDASFGKGIRLSHLNQVPLPPRLDELELDGLVAEYLDRLKRFELGAGQEEEARRMLLRIDAFVLAAYDLPPRLERSLLGHFAGHKRQVPFAFDRFYPEGGPALPLGAFVAGVPERALWSRLAPAFEALDEAEFAGVWDNVG